MMPYILHASILFAACFIFYWLFIKRETFFQLNRWVLIASILCSVLLPLLTIPASWSLRDQASLVQTEALEQPSATSHTTVEIVDTKEELSTASTTTEDIIMESTEEMLSNTPSPAASETAWNIPSIASNLIFYGYYIGLVVFLLSFLIQLGLLLAKTLILQSVKDGKFRIVELTKDEAPYSFWNAIFINPSMYDLATYEQIIAHEKIHIQQVHFFDKLLAELALIIFWFNPFVWFIRDAITNNLEFLTDHNMLQNGVEKESYQMSLLKVSVPQHPLNLSTNYNQSFLKNRIAMMNTKKSSAQSIWKYLFILPLLVLSVLSLNAVHLETADENNLEKNSLVESTETDRQKSTVHNHENAAHTSTTQHDRPAPSTYQSVNAIFDQDDNNKLRLQEIDGSPLEKLKKDLLSNLMKDKLIQSKTENIQLELQSSNIFVNGNSLPSNLAKKYKTLIDSYKIKACPCEHILITEEFIRIGNMTARGFQGSIHGNYDIDQNKHLGFVSEEEREAYEEAQEEALEEEMERREEELEEEMERREEALEEEQERREEELEAEQERREEAFEAEQERLEEQLEAEQERREEELEAEQERREEALEEEQERLEEELEAEQERREEELEAEQEAREEALEEEQEKLEEKLEAEQENNFEEDRQRKDYRDSNFFQNEEEEALEDLANYHHMRLNQKSNPHWKWPDFQAAIIAKLKKDNLLKDDNKFRLYMGSTYLKVNRNKIRFSRFKKYLQLFKDYDIPYSKEWSFKKNGDNIIIINNIDNVNIFKKELLDLLSKHKLIKSKSARIKLEIPGHQLILNENIIDASHLASVHKLLKRYGIQAAPGKKIEMNLPNASIMVGYRTEPNTHTGTWLSN